MTSFALIVPLFLEIFSDTKQLGLATLILVGAAFVGIGVASRVPRDRGPNLFGMLAALSVVGLLAYFGIEAAGIVLWILLALALLLGLFAMVA